MLELGAYVIFWTCLFSLLSDMELSHVCYCAVLANTLHASPLIQQAVLELGGTPVLLAQCQVHYTLASQIIAETACAHALTPRCCAG